VPIDDNVEICVPITFGECCRARDTLEGKQPNAESLAAIQELRDGGGETFPSVDDLMKDLESDD
jgi:hypothetical protein